jgi:predicted nucleic acid-binding protein
MDHRAILIEIGNAFASYKRDTAIRFIDRAFATPNIRVVTVDRGLLKRSLDLYRKRNDKAWGLTDCISFVVMLENRLTDAATADRHFVQAGFNALLL